MELLLLRVGFTDEATEGVLLIDGKFECYTLEDAVREGPKVPGHTAIPAGTYGVVVNWSPRFGQMMPLLLDVPGFVGVRIHVGNKPEDTVGCILVGADQVSLRDAWIGRSRVAYDKLLPKLQAAHPVRIRIVDVRP